MACPLKPRLGESEPQLISILHSAWSIANVARCRPGNRFTIHSRRSSSLQPQIRLAGRRGDAGAFLVGHSTLCDPRVVRWFERSPHLARVRRREIFTEPFQTRSIVHVDSRRDGESPRFTRHPLFSDFAQVRFVTARLVEVKCFDSVDGVRQFNFPLLAKAIVVLNALQQP